MYLFDPTLLQIVVGLVAALAAAFLAAWLVTGASGSGPAGKEGGDDVPARPEPAQEELETRQKVVLWTAAGAALLFLLWWATLSTGSGGQPVL